eukprot:11031248-Heterocapsa_arctica.AAC.1
MITWFAAEVTDRAGDVAIIQFSIADHAVVAKVVVELVAEPSTHRARSSPSAPGSPVRAIARARSASTRRAHFNAPAE